MNSSEWNAFASEYAAIQRESRLPIETDVAAYLANQLPLAKATLVDLAAGSGRYSVPLAGLVQHMTLLDWAPAMLAEARAWMNRNQRTNADYRVADWRTLPPAPLADYAFISQLPTLAASDVPSLKALVRKGLIFNVQTEQSDALTNQVASLIKQPPLPIYQVHPELPGELATALGAQAVLTRQFSYTIPQETTVADSLAMFAASFSFAQAQAISDALTNTSDVNAIHLVPVTYTFTVLIWQAG